MATETEPFECDKTDFGPLDLLEGTWKNEPNLPGHGWNMIALPFATADTPFNFRLLLNQYNEVLKITKKDGCVPNRGIRQSGEKIVDADQFVGFLDYEQSITQIAAADIPKSGRLGDIPGEIHFEPGLWLHMKNETTDGLDIARLGSIPHGDSVLALGRSSRSDGAPVIPEISGLPIGLDDGLEGPYMAPYKHFHDNLFEKFFDPTIPNALLADANGLVDIVRTTELTVDTTIETGGVFNIPFVVRQANAAEMRSTFWIQELAEQDRNGNPKLRLQYSQVVMLDFFPRRDGVKGLIRWPHVSINTMEKDLTVEKDA